MDFLKNLGGGNIANMANLLKQAQNMKATFDRVKAEAEAKYFEAEAGGDRVKVRVSGLGVVDSVSIAPELLSSTSQEVVEGLVKTALNDALEKVKDNLKSEGQKLAGDVNIPGM